ncbi:oligosaccharide flippase family protein, partial [Klebsiella pneumoniae]
MKANVGRETIYLYLVQISNIILPLVLVPYLAHVLGVEFFGKLSYAQAISYIAIFFVDFGFNFSAARNIGIDTNNNKNISRIYSNVQVIKSLIFIAVVLLGIAFVLLSNQSIIDKKLTILGVLSASSSILMPAWLFQGLGRNSNVAFLNFASRLLSLLLIVLFVKNQ